MTEIRIAAPKRSQKWRLTCPATPARPSSSVPGEVNGTMTPVGVRASVHRTNTRDEPCCTSLCVSPTSFVPRSSNTTLPSALNVSVGVMHVVIPGSVVSIAVSKVQSMNAPFGSSRRCVGSTRACTAGVAMGASSVDKVADRAGTMVAAAPAAPEFPEADSLAADVAPSAAGSGFGTTVCGCFEYAGPESLRSSATCAADLGGGNPGAAAYATSLRLADGTSKGAA